LLHGGIITEPTRTFLVGTDIADLQDPPVNFLQTISDSSILSITQVQVGLNLVGRDGGGFASEMFVSLNKDLSLTSILVNRVGVSATDSVGQSYDGWNVTLSDLADSDLHQALQGADILSGIYQPDGRPDPASALRPELLDVFNGDIGNGDWRLSVGDLDLGGTMRLVSWSLTLTGDTVAVPEPSTCAAGLAVLGLVGAAWWRRSRGGNQ
jgi:MYXO-CTERM domain-containing protein